MKCDRCRELLSWYMESDLKPKKMEEVEKHLSVCKECSDELELLKKALTLARKLPKVTISPETRSQLLKKIKSRANPEGTVCIWEKIEDDKRVEIYMLETGQRTPSKQKSGAGSQHWSGVIQRYDGIWQTHTEVKSA